MSETSYGLCLPRPTWLTNGAIRLGILAAFIVGIGMLPGTPLGIAATSRGARSATMIELLTALALLSAYVGSFIDFQRRGDDDHDESTAARSLSPRPDRHTST